MPKTKETGWEKLPGAYEKASKDLPILYERTYQLATLIKKEKDKRA